MALKIRKKFNSFQYFCANVSVTGWKYVVDDDSSILMRILWVLCNMFLIAITCFLVKNLWQSYMDNPTVTSLQFSTHNIADIPFPGISICNVNKISKRKALAYAYYLTNLTGESVEQMLEKVKLLGYLYDFHSTNDKGLVDFQNFLDSIEVKPASLLRELAPTCEGFLMECVWDGHTVNCSEHFKFLVTFEGYCCVFNYWKFQLGSQYPEVKHQRTKGYGSGLTVRINNDPADYFYTNFPTKGVNIHIFSPSDFLDMVSGSLSQVLAGMGTETILNIEPSIYSSSSGIIKYPLEKRQCFFGPEKPTIFGQYSESDCLVSCRVKLAMKLCGCVPFHVPFQQSVVCDLRDIPCLSQYKVKWRMIYPADTDDEALVVEIENDLRCDVRCFPSCDSIIYGFSSNSPQLFLDNENAEITENNTLIHINLEDLFVNVYKQDETFLWFEILGNFGGIISLSLGFSLLSFIEIFLYCTKYLIFRLEYEISY